MEKGDTELSSGHSMGCLVLTIRADGLLVSEMGEMNSFLKCSSYFFVLGGRFRGRGDRLNGIDISRFSIKGFQ